MGAAEQDGGQESGTREGAELKLGEPGGPPGSRGGIAGPRWPCEAARAPRARPVRHVDPLGAWMLGPDWSGLTPTALHPHSPGPAAWPFRASVSSSISCGCC